MFGKRNRTSPLYIESGLYLYFLGLSTRGVAKALLFLQKIKRSHVAIWRWIQKYKPQKVSIKRKKISEFIIDETLVKVGSEYIWLWIAIEPKNRQILAASISKERNMFVADRFISGLVETYGKHGISTDGGTWYPQACRFLRLKHHLHTSLEKSLIERTMQYIKDRTECFDDYFPCRLKDCKLKHVRNWLNLFVDYHNKGVIYA
ncbi:MAG: DDE-type integrase/transposase/recombinase [Nitrososphaeraceae archaeon]